MRLKITFISILTVITSLFLFNFNSDDLSNINNKNELTSKKNKTTQTSYITDSIPNHRINAKVAQTDMNEYQAYIEGVKSTVQTANGLVYTDPGAKLINGAQVDLSELIQILMNAQAGDDLYIMMGIKGDSTEMYFALNSVQDDSWDYFDFTRPCPNACPDFQ